MNLYSPALKPQITMADHDAATATKAPTILNYAVKTAMKILRLEPGDGEEPYLSTKLS